MQTRQATTMSPLALARVCMAMACLNAGALFLPPFEGAALLATLASALAVNALVWWRVLASVGPWASEDTHLLAVKFVKRWYVLAGVSMLALGLVLALAGRFGRQEVIFWMLGFACFGLCQKSLDLAIDKKIDALVAESEEPIGRNE